jgi:predicted permease
MGGTGSNTEVWLDGADRNGRTRVSFNWIGEGYLETLGIALLSGRDFTARDSFSSPNVAIVNQSFARRLRLVSNPVGVRFRRQAEPSQPEAVYEIVGLVRDTKYFDLREDFRPIVFLPTAQNEDPRRFTDVMIRSTALSSDAASSVSGAIAEISPAIGVEFRAFDSTIRDRLLRERLMATLSGFFGLLAALIAAVGLYGVMSYLVARRANEIGLRMALGAERGDILAMVLRQAGVLLSIGLALGLLLALASAETTQSLLFGLQPRDLRSAGLACALLGAVTAAASFLPARRAAKLEPLAALREE